MAIRVTDRIAVGRGAFFTGTVRLYVDGVKVELSDDEVESLIDHLRLAMELGHGD